MSVAERLAGIRERMAEACARAGRAESDVALLAVSKTVVPELMLEAWAAGQREFGESRQQEAAAKLGLMPAGGIWHFIGRIQRNKVRKILENFTVLHGVDSLKLAAAIDRIAIEMGLRPEIFLEVNLGGEDSKGGFAPQEMDEVIAQLPSLPGLQVKGLMAIPPVPDGDAEAARPWFRRLRELRDSLQERHGIPLPGLSMGMSGDFQVAIEEGSTMVRVGSAIFGERNPI